jgi:hypothetical protein
MDPQHCRISQRSNYKCDNSPLLSHLLRLYWGEQHRRLGLNRMCNGRDHYHIAQRPDYVQCTFTIALMSSTSMSRSTSSSLGRMNHLFKVQGHRRVAVRSAFDDPFVHVGLLNDAAIIHFSSLSHHTNSSGVGRLLHQQRVVCSGGDDKTTKGAYIRWW